MTHELFPCIWFDGTAEEAAKFYCSIFENSKIKQVNPIVTTFQLCGKQVMGLNGGPRFKPTPSLSLFVKCSTVEQVNTIYAKLMEGGSALIPVDQQPWSERYGWVKDKYGMTWQIMKVEEHEGKQEICPSLLFVNNLFGKAAEAIDLYTSVFPDSSLTVKELYPAGDINAGKTMFAEFKLNNYTMTAMDGPGDHKYSFSEGVSLVVTCDTQEEIDHYWNKLTSNGGEESMCGWLKDKFGVSWQVVPAVLGKLMAGPKAQEVVQAFMKMKKFVIADLEKAAT